MTRHSDVVRSYGDSIPPGLLASIEDVGYKAAELFDRRDMQRTIKADNTLQTSIDTACERNIIEILQSVSLPAPILAEEDACSKEITHGVEHSFFWSVDPIDGTSRLGAGFERSWAVSVGAVLHGVPTIGIVALPKEDLLYATPNIGGSVSVRNGVAYDHALLGLTLGGMVAKNPHYWEFNRQLILEFGSMLSEPSVMSGIDFLTGRTRLFVASNSHHWDLCAVAALALRQGAIVRHCDGTPIDWSPRREKFKPVVFARTQENAVRVSKLYFNSYEYIHPHNK